MTRVLQTENPLAYETVRQTCFAWGTCPNGWGDPDTNEFYREHRAQCGFALLGTSVVIVSASGYHNSSIPNCESEREALWYLRNHPNGKRYYEVESVKPGVDPREDKFMEIVYIG